MPITTAKELIDAVMSAVPNLTSLPRAQTAAWFPTTSSIARTYGGQSGTVTETSHSPTMFRSGEEVPIDSNSLVFSIFFDDEVIRVYTLGKAPPSSKPEGWVARPPTRYTLSRSAPTYVAEIMSLDTMAEEMIDEWTNIESGMSSAEAEREAVIEWLASFGAEPLPPASELIQDFRDEIHLESDDDEEEDEADAAGAVPTGVAAPPVSPVPSVSPVSVEAPMAPGTEA